MKKSRNPDLKKLALLGIAGGTVMAVQAPAEINNVSELLAFNGCASHGCSGVGGKGGSYQAYRNSPSDAYYYSAPSSGCSAASSQQYYQSASCHAASQQYYQSASCHAASQQYYQSASCHAASQGNYYQSSGSCHAASQGNYYQPSQGSYYQSSAGCANHSIPQTAQYQTAAGCAHHSAPMGQSYASQPSAGCSSLNANPSANPTISSWAHPTSNNPSSTSAANQSTYTQWEPAKYTADTDKEGNKGSGNSATSTKAAMTEGELLNQLNEPGKQAYKTLDPAGKALALKLANQDCKGQNDCKGLNSCKADDHACAGKGSCAGTAKANFKDKNLAVKVAALKMAEKRAKPASSNY